jgi:predicted peroxiredoxin
VGRLFVNLTAGPENPTRAALAFLVARTALKNGHEVDLFLGGDAVGLLRPVTIDALHGIGAGSLREHVDALTAGGARFFASAMSSKVRAVDADAVGGIAVDFVLPDRLVELVFEADRVISY